MMEEAVGDSFAIGAEDIGNVVHSEEVETSTPTTIDPSPPVITPPAAPQAPVAVSALGPVYSIPTLVSTAGPVMQVVTLQNAPPSQPPGLTNALRNVRLITIQPKTLNGFNGRPQPISLNPRPEIRQPQPQNSKNMQVINFYGKTNNSPTTVRVMLPKAPSHPSPKLVNKPAPPPVKASPSYYKELQREKEMREFSHLNDELRRGLRILLDLTTSLQHNTTFPFMERVDPVKDGAPDYDRVITQPMWLSRIKEKFRNNDYTVLTQFVADMRLILENCYRYNGPNHPITKKALRLEQCFEQKITLLPVDLRAQCALVEDDSERKARIGSSSESYFSPLLHRVRHERQERERLAKERKAEEQRKRREERERQRCIWAEKMMNPEVKAQMRTMWEIPQIGHFLHLARTALNVGEIAQYELEHMFLMPEASVLLATLVTSLLSSPNQRIKLAESPPTPYAIWSARIGSRVVEWYRTYNREGRNVVKVHEQLGIEPMFWRVCGDTTPMVGGRLYHQLSFLKRVWVFKALCDTVAHSHKTVQEAMASEEVNDSRQVTLGQDALGFTYVHFPAVSGSDIRVYRQKGWELENDPIWGPIAAERLLQEEERQRELEEKLAAKAALNKRRRPTPVKSRKSASPSKKRQPAKPVNTTPQRKRQAPEERPSRIGTRVSPRTLQRQTGLTLYKDTSSESEESEEENDTTVPSDDDDAQILEKEDQSTEPAEPETTPASKKNQKPRKRAGWGSRRRSRKKPPAKKKELEKIVEAKDEEEEASLEVPLQDNKPLTLEGDKSCSLPDDKTSSEMLVDEEEKSPSPELQKETSSPVLSEQPPLVTPTDQSNSVKTEDVKQEDETLVKPEPVEPTQDIPMSESEPKEVKEVLPLEGTASKVEEPVTEEEKPAASSSQRFTVSQLVQKLAKETPEEEEKPEFNGENLGQENGQPEPIPTQEEYVETQTPSSETTLPDIPDPERSSYDPFFFELIISSVEELQEWINKFSDACEKPTKSRPRCEVKLCERFQSLLEEAQPLAVDQERANQKISQQLWKEWERYRCLSNKTTASSADQIYDSADSELEHEEEGVDSGKSESEDDGIRHSKRIRQRRNRQQESHNEEDEEEEEEQQPPTKQRKTSYNYDPGWDHDPSGVEELQMASRRRKASFDPEMKNPGYWVGRRMTRATAAFAGSAEDFDEGSPSNSPPQQQRTDSQDFTGLKETSSGSTQSDKLADQLRQLRRQQDQLSSNDPLPATNGSPPVYFATRDKDGKPTRILIDNPRKAELLSQFKRQQQSSPAPKLAPKMVTTSSPVVAPSAASSPSSVLLQPATSQKKILLGIPSANGSIAASIDITVLVNQAALKGLIVSHESRCLTMDLGPHGRFLVMAQLTTTGPRVISATPLPSNNTNVIANAGQVTNGCSNNSNTNPPQPAKMLVSDTRNSNVISPEILRAVAGPDAGEAKLTIVKEGANKVLTLILPNGEMRRLTTSQVQQIQAAVRNNKSQNMMPAAPAPVPVAAADGATS